MNTEQKKPETIAQRLARLEKELQQVKQEGQVLGKELQQVKQVEQALGNLIKEQGQMITVLQDTVLQQEKKKDRVIFTKKLNTGFQANQPNTWVELFSFIPPKEVQQVIVRGVINFNLGPLNSNHCGVYYDFNNDTYAYNEPGIAGGKSVLIPIYCYRTITPGEPLVFRIRPNSHSANTGASIYNGYLEIVSVLL